MMAGKTENTKADRLPKLSDSEELVLQAVWEANPPVTRREIERNLPDICHWADSTVLNFLYRLEEKGYIATEKLGNKNTYRPLVRRTAYRRQSALALLNGLFGGSTAALVDALADSPQVSTAALETLRARLDERLTERMEYDDYELYR